MDDETKMRVLARQLVHERLLSYLMAVHLKPISPEQRQLLEEQMGKPPELTALPQELRDDLQLADNVAGFAMHYRAAMHRIIRSALKPEDNG